MRDRLIELLKGAETKVTEMLSTSLALEEWLGIYADHLLANGVIVPPCKVGDKLYKLCSVNSKIEMGRLWGGNIVKTNCDRCSYRKCSCYDIGIREQDKPYFINVIEEKTAYSLEFIVRIMPYFGTIWFTSKEEAERALKERERE